MSGGRLHLFRDLKQ